MSKPKTDWPQIVLTNAAEFQGHTPLYGASGFLIRTDDNRVLAATASHLIGAAGGVEPAIPVNELTSKIDSWKMFPRTLPDEAVEITSLGAQGLDDDRLDWLILSIKETETLPSYPLKIRSEPIRVGEMVYLIGCPYCEANCKQNVYTGAVTERGRDDRFRYDLDPPVDLRGFSGAPLVDQNGFVVGVMTVWFNPKTSDELHLEGGGEDIASIVDLLESAR